MTPLRTRGSSTTRLTAELSHTHARGGEEHQCIPITLASGVGGTGRSEHCCHLRPVMYVEQLVCLVTVLIQHISIDNYYYYITISVLVREFKGLFILLFLSCLLACFFFLSVCLFSICLSFFLTSHFQCFFDSDFQYKITIIIAIDTSI